ncbi:MAG: hypothetical protein JWP82_1010 [Humibacillus sp.]|nr:hypothetical protein [Humibacillus sp.]
MSRSDATSSSLRRRPSRTVPATLAAIVITGLGVAGVWASVEKLSSGRWPTWVGSTHKWFGSQTWSDPTVITVAAVVALVGLLLLLSAIKPGMPNAYEIEGADVGDTNRGDTDFVMTRRSVAKLARAHAATVPGVDSVSASATSRRVTLEVKTLSEQGQALEERVTAQVTDALTAAGLSPQPTVRTTARTTQP